MTTYLVLILGLFLSSCTGQRVVTGKSTAKLPFGGVNAPVSSQRLTGKMDVIGWALSEDGIESVSVYLDRKLVGDCSIGLSRPDVAKAYPNIAGSQVSGWRTTVDTSAFSPNWHELTIQAKSKAGTTRDLASLAVVIVQ